MPSRACARLRWAQACVGKVWQRLPRLRMATESALTGEHLKISQAADVLGVSPQTLRNWDRQGRLVPQRHPINGYRIYRLAEIQRILRKVTTAPVVRESASAGLQTELALYNDPEATPTGPAGLPRCHWNAAVALDPRHRPQKLDEPSSTVRRDWRKYPQEAHLLDAANHRYRRLAPHEIAILQGFDPEVVSDARLTDRQRIAALGDAVPPPLARALCAAIDSVWEWHSRTTLEICAGIGGLAEGSSAIRLKHLALIDRSAVVGSLLRRSRPWPADAVTVEDVRAIDYKRYRGRVGLLSGGPPCQPWSLAGRRHGQFDERDLFGWLPDLVSMTEPEVFLFENVPGLVSPANSEYLRSVLAQLERPSPQLRYGLLVAKLNAADFGVPQKRHRVFVLGFRDSPAALASRAFDEVAARQTHAGPGARQLSLPRWRTVGDALRDLPDPGGWRQWIV